MKKQLSSRSGLLLMEIMTAILSFSIVSAICLQIFVKAHNLAQDTQELDMAVRQSESVAVILSQTDRPMKRIQEIYPGSKTSEEHASVYFDKDFQSCKSSDSLYHLEITSDQIDEQTTSYAITVYKNDNSKELYYLEITAYSQYTL